MGILLSLLYPPTTHKPRGKICGCFRSFYSIKMTFRDVFAGFWVTLSVLKLTLILRLARVFSPISVVVFRTSTAITVRSSILGLSHRLLIKLWNIAFWIVFVVEMI